MDPIRKSAVTSITPKPVTETGGGPGKTGGSKFADVQRASRPAEEQQSVNLPKPVEQVTPEQRAELERDLRKKLEAGGARNPQDMFRGDMRTAEADIARLNHKVQSMPKSEGTNLLRDRLAGIEDHFTSSREMLGQISGTSSPRDLMKLQMQIYQMTQNIEIVSKVVEQMSGGVKQILQTQI